MASREACLESKFLILLRYKDHSSSFVTLFLLLLLPLLVFFLCLTFTISTLSGCGAGYFLEIILSIGLFVDFGYDSYLVTIFCCGCFFGFECFERDVVDICSCVCNLGDC